MTEALLVADAVTKHYGPARRRTVALENVSVTVRHGESVGIVGESGAGKSTLLRLLLGLERPSSGVVMLEGRPVDIRDRATMRALRRQVQVVFQDPRSSLDPRMRVGRSIAEPLRSLRVPGPHEARVAELLEQVGLEPEMARRYPNEFSGGQRQRIAIARALAPGPSVLIADEPVSALDMTVRQQIIDLLERLATERGMSLVMVSHDMAIVGRLCERVLVMRSGQVVEAGATASVFADPQQEYTRALLDAVPQLPDVV